MDYNFEDGLLTSITLPNPDSESEEPGPTTTFEYDPSTKLLIAETDALGRTTRYEYDNFNRLMRTINPDGTFKIFEAPETSAMARRIVVGYDGSTPIHLGSAIFSPVDDSIIAAPLIAWNQDGFSLEPVHLGPTGRTVDEAGNITHYTMDAGGKISSVTESVTDDPTAPWATGPTTFYLHDLERELLTAVVAPSPSGSGHTTTRYTYDDKFNLTEIEYPDLKTETWNYLDPDNDFEPSPLNLVFGHTVHGGVAGSPTTTYHYTEDGLLDTITGPGDDPPITTFTYANGATPGIPKGLIASMTDPLGNVTTYTYYSAADSETDLDGSHAESGQLHTITVGQAYVSEVLTSFPETATTELFYDEFGNVSKQIDPDDRVTTFAYDDLGRLTQTQQRGLVGAETAGPTWKSKYNALGQVIQTTDPNENDTQYLYDVAERLAGVVMPKPDGDGEMPGPETVFVYAPAGQVETVIDPLGRHTQYAYNSRGQLATMTEAQPDDGQIGEDSPQTQYAYNRAGYLASVTDANGNITKYEYDANRGWLLNVKSVHLELVEEEEVEVSNNSQEDGLVVEYTYNTLGERFSQRVPLDSDESVTTLYFYDDLGQVTKTAHLHDLGTGGIEVTNYGYDAAGHLTSETVDPDDPDTSYTGLNLVTQWTYDHQNRLASQLDPPPGEEDSPTTEYLYDKAGHRISLTDPNDNETTWTYDPFGRMHTEVNVAGTRTYDYDSNGNLVEYTDRDDRETDYAYDRANRMIAEQWIGGPDAQTLHYAYDVLGNLISTSDTASSNTFTYDGLNRQTSAVSTIAGLSDSVTLASAYDGVGNRLSLGATIGATDDFLNTYGYDHLNRLIDLVQNEQGGGNEVAVKDVGLGYNDAGQLTAINRFNQVADDPSDPEGDGIVAASAYTYNGFAGRLSGLTTTLADSSTITQGWQYDKAARVKQYSHSSDDTLVYHYDGDGQLIDYGVVEEDPTQTWTYDANGNRLTTGEDESTPGALNRLEIDGTYTYQYDAEGNQVVRDDGAGNIRQMRYDHRNRLIEVEDYTSASVTDLTVTGTSAHKVVYGYDTLNHLVSRIHYIGGSGTPTNTENSIWDGNNVVLKFASTGASPRN